MVAVISCPQPGCTYEACAHGPWEHADAADLLDLHLAYTHNAPARNNRIQNLLNDPEAMTVLHDRIT